VREKDRMLEEKNRNKMGTTRYESLRQYEKKGQECERAKKRKRRSTKVHDNVKDRENERKHEKMGKILKE